MASKRVSKLFHHVINALSSNFDLHSTICARCRQTLSTLGLEKHIDCIYIQTICFCRHESVCSLHKLSNFIRKRWSLLTQHFWKYYNCQTLDMRQMVLFMLRLGDPYKRVAYYSNAYLSMQILVFMLFVKILRVQKNYCGPLIVILYLLAMVYRSVVQPINIWNVFYF